MLSTRLNLLSPEKKTALERIIIFQFTKNLLQILLIVFCVAGILLLGSQSVLQKYFNQLASSLTTIDSSYADANRQIQTINRILEDANSVQKEYYVWTPSIKQITEAVPAGIQLMELDLSREKKHISISGIAKERNNLLELQNRLKNMECGQLCIQDVSLPPSQLTKKEDISFSITATIK